VVRSGTFLHHFNLAGRCGPSCSDNDRDEREPGDDIALCRAVVPAVVMLRFEIAQ
jgi:hypothetical protein